MVCDLCAGMRQVGLSSLASPQANEGTSLNLPCEPWVLIQGEDTVS